MLHATRWKCRMQKFAICTSMHNFVKLCLYNQGMYRQSEKNLLNGNISSTSPHNMVNFSPLTAEIGWWVLGTRANFNGFRILASLQHQCRSMEINQTLHDDVWPSPGLLHYIYIFGGSCPITEFCQVQNLLCIEVLHSPILAVLLHSTRAVVVSQSLRRGSRNGIMELSLLVIFMGATYILRVAIMLGIGPHSSLVTVFTA